MVYIMEVALNTENGPLAPGLSVDGFSTRLTFWLTPCDPCLLHFSPQRKKIMHHLIGGWCSLVPIFFTGEEKKPVKYLVTGASFLSLHLLSGHSKEDKVNSRVCWQEPHLSLGRLHQPQHGGGLGQHISAIGYRFTSAFSSWRQWKYLIFWAWVILLYLNHQLVPIFQKKLMNVIFETPISQSIKESSQNSHCCFWL